MCGLIGWVSRDETAVAPDFVLDQYERQWGRGQRGFGLIEINKEKIRIRRATEPVKALLDVARSNAPTLLFHHRLPTSTGNELEQAHPMLVSHDELQFDYHVMHNGVIRNPDECRHEHEGLGYAYRTIEDVTLKYPRFNDSEAFAIELARFIEKKSEGLRAYGPAAFLGVALDKKTGKPVKIFFGTNGDNPLRVMEGTGLLLGSELPEDASDPCMPEMLYEVDCKKLFGRKSKTGVMEDIFATPLTYLPEPRREPILPLTTKRIGFEMQKREAKFDLDDTIPEREEAVQKRLDRFMTDLTEDILIPAFGPFFDNAAYEDMTEDDIDELLMSLRDELLDQLPLLKEIRDHFDTVDEADYKDMLADQRRFREEETDTESINYDHDRFKHISEYLPRV